jgi:hypothetical protein
LRIVVESAQALVFDDVRLIYGAIGIESTLGGEIRVTHEGRAMVSYVPKENRGPAISTKGPLVIDRGGKSFSLGGPSSIASGTFTVS